MSSSRDEARSLTRGAFVLLVVSVVRYGGDLLDRYSTDPPGSGIVLDSLAVRTREAIDERERRSRPFEVGETVDPNHADATELDRLPGVGPSTAEAIVAARDTGPAFRSPSDLLVVRGIGPATLERIEPHLDLAGAGRRRAVSKSPGGRPAVPARQALRPPPHVDVNSADPALLETLPGIGPSLAARILEERTQRPFEDVDDLARVRGIGPSTVERLRGLAVARRRR